MARAKSKQKAPAQFVLKDSKSKANYPSARSNAVLSEDGEMMAAYLDQLRQGLFMPKVNSNSELLQRVGEYFEVCKESQTPPTVAGLCLYCGYSHYQFSEWRKGNKQFPNEPGVPSTSEIIKACASILLGLNESMAMQGKLNPVTYIFTSCNYFGLQQKNTVQVNSSSDDEQKLSRDQIEEIASALPDGSIDGEGTVK